MILLTQLVNDCNRLLDIHAFNDYAPNGLQVEGAASISKIITGVTASMALIERAIAEQAQAIIVHHGYFWKGEASPLVGMKGARIKRLMQHDISLLAYHLPLDAHPTLGNNAYLSKQLELTCVEALNSSYKPSIGCIGELAAPLSVNAFKQLLIQKISPDLQWIDGGRTLPITRVGLCTGAAQDLITYAHAQSCDVYISGEISERTVHEAHELGIHYASLGHHRTEVGGVKELALYLKKQYPTVDVQFINIDTSI